jgi:hypothetical protein
MLATPGGGAARELVEGVGEGECRAWYSTGWGCSDSVAGSMLSILMCVKSGLLELHRERRACWSLDVKLDSARLEYIRTQDISNWK